MKRGIWISVLTTLVLSWLVIGELAARSMGLGDVPLYTASNALGYVPKPNQSGAFLNRYRFEFNELGMGTGRRFESAPEDVLLIGDSIVHGGARTDQPMRLGPSLERASGRRVWPVGAASWALANQLAYLEQNPQAMRVKTLVFVLNFADFAQPSVWASEFSHPTAKPASALAFVVGKKLRTTADAPTPTPSEHFWSPALSALLDAHDGRVLFVLYPTAGQLKRPSPYFEPLRAFLAARPDASVCEISRPAWSRADYVDGLHPNPASNAKLARLINGCLEGRSATAP